MPVNLKYFSRILDNLCIVLDERGILGQFGRSFFGISCYINSPESLRSWNIMVYLGISLKMQTPTPAPDHLLGGHEGGRDFDKPRWGLLEIGSNTAFPTRASHSHLSRFVSSPKSHGIKEVWPFPRHTLLRNLMVDACCLTLDVQCLMLDCLMLACLLNG